VEHSKASSNKEAELLERIKASEHEAAQLKEQLKQQLDEAQAQESSRSDDSELKTKLAQMEASRDELKRKVAELGAKKKSSSSSSSSDDEETREELERLKKALEGEKALRSEAEKKLAQKKSSSSSSSSSEDEELREELEAAKKRVAEVEERLKEERKVKAFVQQIWESDVVFNAKQKPMLAKNISTFMKQNAASKNLKELAESAFSVLATLAESSKDGSYWLSVAVHLFSSLRKLNNKELQARSEALVQAAYKSTLMQLFGVMEPLVVPAVFAPSSAKQGVGVRNLTAILNTELAALAKMRVPLPLVKQYIHQAFAFIAHVVFNSLTKDLCKSESMFKIKLELSKIEDWVSGKEEPLRDAGSQLEPILEAVNLMVLEKSILGEKDVLDQVCPHLNYKQVKYLLRMFQPDANSPGAVPASVFSALDELIKTQRNAQVTYDLAEIPPANLRFLNEAPKK
jgi:hypothetical protein